MAKNLKNIDLVILCGGLGKRLRAEVGRTQKTMAEVSGQPFLDILLKYLHGQGFRRAILCTGFQARQVEEHFRNNKLGMKIVFSRENKPLGTGGAIRNARSKIKSDPFVALNGDCFCRLDYKKFVQFYFSRRAKAILALTRSRDRRDYGSVKRNAQGRIEGFAEKSSVPSSRKADSIFISNGIYCFAKDILKLMPKEKRFSIETEFFPGLPEVLKEKFLGFIVRNPFLDIGTPERYRKAQTLLVKH